MKVLLDSNALLLFIAEPTRMLRKTRDLVASADTEAFTSIASLWELSIKAGLGKLTLPADMLDLVSASGITLLSIEPQHTLHVARLPLHHRDPFDRLIVAQAIIEQMALVTRDQLLARYGVAIIAV
ncbi:MAG TPA: type II toxin-antitoxin system VapC family toxin [Vineibacter sp.]|nr:type II toxin-antitoxin system VapC family toxin [Vineibacter sp.]